jgi:hypothetical protein
VAAVVGVVVLFILELAAHQEVGAVAEQELLLPCLLRAFQLK